MVLKYWQLSHISWREFVFDYYFVLFCFKSNEFEELLYVSWHGVCMQKNATLNLSMNLRIVLILDKCEEDNTMMDLLWERGYVH